MPGRVVQGAQPLLLAVTTMRSILTLNDLRAAFDGETYPTLLPAELYDRAKREGYDMIGYVRTPEHAHYGPSDPERVLNCPSAEPVNLSAGVVGRPDYDRALAWPRRANGGWGASFDD
jgi:hypothetical protein